jgi:hypothetical protein
MSNKYFAGLIADVLIALLLFGGGFLLTRSLALGVTSGAVGVVAANLKRGDRN